MSRKTGARPPARVAAGVLLGLCCTSVARGEPVPAREHEVKFQAQHVEVDGSGEGLRLSGDVVVRAERFQITSSDIQLSRSRRGLHVVGAGRLSFCPCPAPPITLGFSSADFAPPTDILLYGASLRVGGVPLFWSPLLWLRAADRVGVLPPSFGYRGEEGLSFGSGVHVPLGPPSPTPSRLDLKLSGYSRGGVRGAVQAQTESGFSNVSLDVLRERAALDISSQWSAALDSGAVLAERVELLRGDRAQVAPATLDRVALPKDRLRIALGHASRQSYAFSLQGDAPRALGLGNVGLLGPAFSLGLGRALGRSAPLAFELETRSGHGRSGDVFLAHAGWTTAVAVPISVLLWETELRQRASWLSLEQAAASAVRSVWRTRLGLPLLRRSAQQTTWLEPYAELASIAARSGGDKSGPIEEGLGSAGVGSTGLGSTGLLSTALLGLRAAWGGRFSRRALEWGLAAGGVMRETQAKATAPLISSLMRANFTSWRATGQLAWDPRSRALEGSLRTQLGFEPGPQLGLRLDARNDASLALRAPALGTLEGDGVAWNPALAMAGTSLRARLGTPLPLGLSASFGSDFDLTASRLLASAAELAYRHRCKCVSLFLVGSRRSGRQGFDLNLGLELFAR